MDKETCTFRLDDSDLEYMLRARGSAQQRLFKKASQVRNECVSEKVYFRGLIEFSNICENDCLYCGIRKSNKNIGRYEMNKEEILAAVGFCSDSGYGSVVIQSGERKTSGFVSKVSELVAEIKSHYPDIGVTLCVGEHDKKAYQRLFDAGAHRYLLRMETSDKGLYESIHPTEMSFERRVRCLADLREIGFQVGSGVMVGLPGQSLSELAGDLIFLKEFGVHMVGMGPYIPHRDTPLEMSGYDRAETLALSLNMIAALRLLMPYINIASTTALQALHPEGRELGLRAGANIVMPNATPEKYREHYQLYDGKPCIEETSSKCRDCLSGRVRSCGLEPAYNAWGDSRQYFMEKEVENAC